MTEIQDYDHSMQELATLYHTWCQHQPTHIEPLAKAGSNRQYFRITDADGKSVIGVKGTSEAENHSFIYLARHFATKGLPVPHVLAVSDDGLLYLQEDLGTMSLYEALAPARQQGYVYGETDITLLARTIRMLPHIQVEGSEGLDIKECLPPLHFNRRAAMFDLNYFKYSFLKTTDLPFDEELLEDDLEHLASDLVGDGTDVHYFLYRDFQARNVMLAPAPDDGRCTLPHGIDFQSGMLGPLHYDVASFLWQASARYPQQLREKLIGEYLDELSTLLPDVDEETFRLRLQKFVFFRLLQVLGAYGLRGYVERKAYFLNSIPLAIRSLSDLLDQGCASVYPYLEQTLRRLCALPQFAFHRSVQDSNPDTAGRKPLVVRIFSFSYKKGIPEDTSGNGGGYVFDCRSTHNPGRYAPYKQLTGLDRPVIKFLEDDGEILTFLESVYKLADAHVERYMQRGFTDLMFSFGCTGGQHRSVYSAQHLAEHLHSKYGIEVRLEHREQGIRSVLK